MAVNLAPMKRVLSQSSALLLRTSLLVSWGRIHDSQFDIAYIGTRSHMCWRNGSLYLAAMYRIVTNGSRYGSSFSPTLSISVRFYKVAEKPKEIIQCNAMCLWHIYTNLPK